MSPTLSRALSYGDKLTTVAAFYSDSDSFDGSAVTSAVIADGDVALDESC